MTGLDRVIALEMSRWAVTEVEIAVLSTSDPEKIAE
jgi:hypothetical protein